MCLSRAHCVSSARWVIRGGREQLTKDATLVYSVKLTVGVRRRIVEPTKWN